MKRLLTISCLLALGGTRAAAETWTTDFNAAHGLAQETGKPMLVYFYVFDGR